jgi:hypothetical protein
LSLRSDCWVRKWNFLIRSGYFVLKYHSNSEIMKSASYIHSHRSPASQTRGSNQRAIGDWNRFSFDHGLALDPMPTLQSYIKVWIWGFRSCKPRAVMFKHRGCLDNLRGSSESPFAAISFPWHIRNNLSTNVSRTMMSSERNSHKTEIMLMNA